MKSPFLLSTQTSDQLTGDQDTVISSPTRSVRRLATELLSVEARGPLKIHLPRILQSSWEEIDRWPSLHLLRFQLNLAVTELTQPPLNRGQGDADSDPPGCFFLLQWHNTLMLGLSITILPKSLFSMLIFVSGLRKRHLHCLQGLSWYSQWCKIAVWPDRVYIFCTNYPEGLDLRSGSQSGTCRLVSEDG